MSQYGLVGIVDVPDELSMSAVSLAIGTAGHVRDRTLRACTREETEAILKRLP